MLAVWLTGHHPEPQTRVWQDRLSPHAKAEMRVDRHVPRGEGEQIASNTLRISTGRYLAHKGAADAPSLLARLDTEPAEIPMRLRGE